MKQETGEKNGKMKKSGREFLFHYFNMGKSNLVFHTVSNNSWICCKIVKVTDSRRLKFV